MPGPVSDSYKGAKGWMPVVPTWMEDDGSKDYAAWRQEVSCPLCEAFPLVDGKCPADCGYTGEKGKGA